MATNLIPGISQALSAAITTRIASVLGLNEEQVRKAIDAAVPALIGALISLVSKPQGAAKLYDVVAKQEPGALPDVANVIGEAGQQAFIDKGTTALNSLLGKDTALALGGTLAQYSGIGESNSKSLLGLLAPVVLGVFGQEQRDEGLDPPGLARLLTSQKSNVVAALPSGFAKYFGTIGILDDVTTARGPVSREGASRGYPTREPPSVWPWLLGALAVFAIGALASNFLSGRHGQVAKTAPQKVEAPYAGFLAKLRGVKAGDADVGELATSALNDLYASLSGIKDAATAQAALSGLNKASSEFDRLTDLLGQLPPNARKFLADTIVSIRPNITDLMDRVLAIPGVAAIVKPAIDSVNAKLDASVTT
jgi:Bacterial protein of unknown function (DUF937)